MASRVRSQEEFLRTFKTVQFAWLLTFAALMPAATDVHSTVQEATDSLLVRLLEVRPLYRTDPVEFYSAVDATLGPFVDFEGFSKGVMAKYFVESRKYPLTRKRSWPW